ncbi:helix-turn-helix domain-containing protein [Arthrobacter sp. RCC_34]|uniref:helix-turn-helix domain-containing protein n=1 Tax=Arthrobacter sp. RCC_34 TaxID=3239230 RepID=UPI003525921A
MDFEGLSEQDPTADPGAGLRAVVALHRLAERVEATSVTAARDAGWSWEQIGAALGVTRQSVHAKHGKTSNGKASRHV